MIGFLPIAWFNEAVLCGANIAELPELLDHRCEAGILARTRDIIPWR